MLHPPNVHGPQQFLASGRVSGSPAPGLGDTPMLRVLLAELQESGECWRGAGTREAEQIRKEEKGGPRAAELTGKQNFHPPG